MCVRYGNVEGKFIRDSTVALRNNRPSNYQQFRQDWMDLKI